MLRINLYLLVISMLSCHSRQESSSIVKDSVFQEIKVAIVSSKYGGYGYDIFVGNKLMVHQPHIPAIPGISGFKTREDANTVANSVVNKIKNQEFPPTLSVKELQTLGIEF